jgi:ribonuclease R
MAHSDEALIARVGRAAGSKAGYKQLVRELGLGGGRERRQLLDQLAGLVRRKQLVEVARGLWGLPGAATAGSGAKSGASTAAGPGASDHALRSGRERLHSGRLDLHADGYGFVRLEGETGREGDIFIPRHEVHGAMQGDIVLVDEAPAGRDGRRSGRIARVLTRRNPTVVGIFHTAAQTRHTRLGESFSGSHVTPIDDRVTSIIVIPEGAQNAPSAAASPHRTIGNEARLFDPGSLDGLAVDVEITSFPSPGRPALGRVIEVLGPPDAFGVDVEIVIRKHHIPHIFPAPVLVEADESALQTVASLSVAELAARVDFRGLDIVTIDGETARDFDDAVLVRPLANGNTELQVHIADVSWYVRPGSAIDTEARLRGTSVYFPDRAVPMLPHALSSGMCSLLPNEDRLVQSCLMEIDGRGEIVAYRVAEGVIRSVRRCTYTSVQSCLNAAPQPNDSVVSPPSANDLAERQSVELANPGMPAAFDRMLELALRLNAKRVRRGSIDFDLPEPVVQFDPDGNMKAIVRGERGWSHRLIEEFMLSANECVAHWLEAEGIASIYRIHEMPDPKRVMDFEESASQFGQTLGIDSLPVKKFTMKSDRREARTRSSRGQSSRSPQAHELPSSIPVTPQMYQRLVRRIAGTPEQRVLAYLMLRSLKQARYAEKNEGHFALASPSYTHFTSPIRRYPDLIVHRLLRAMLERGADPHGAPILSTEPQPWSSQDQARDPHQRSLRAQANDGPIAADELNDIAVESSQAERRSADAERELIEWKKMRFMEDKIGDDFHATLLSCTKYGFFVELEDMFIEGLVPLGSLVGDHYSFRDTDRTIVGARTGHVFRLGERVEVILDRIDRQQRRLQFALLPGTEPKATSLRTRGKAEPKSDSRKHPAALSPKRSGKAKTRARNKKNKGRR